MGKKVFGKKQDIKHYYKKSAICSSPSKKTLWKIKSLCIADKDFFEKSQEKVMTKYDRIKVCQSNSKQKEKIFDRKLLEINYFFQNNLQYTTS